MRIHAIRTGLLGIKSRYIEAYGRVRLASVLLDTRFVQPVPVYTWAIEHPEGVIVIDTGMNARCLVGARCDRPPDKQAMTAGSSTRQRRSFAAIRRRWTAQRI